MFDQITTLQTLGWLGYLAIFVVLIKSISYSQIVRDKKVQHLVFGAAASLFTLWLFRAGIYEGLDVHFLWLTAMSLLLGLRWALLSAFIALLGITVLGKESWTMFGINGLLGICVPVVLSYLVYNFSFHKLPRHLFIYIFICAFIPGTVMIATKMFLLGGYYYLDGIHDWITVKDNYLALIPLMLFPEGMLNGMTMTLLIIYKPTWVYTFYDKFYLNGK